MSEPDQQGKDLPASSSSGGNEGARGSRGQANSGAQPGNSTQERGNGRAAGDGAPDLRDADAQGGGGIASNTSRSK